MKNLNQKGFVHLALVAVGAVIGLFVAYVAHLPR